MMRPLGVLCWSLLVISGSLAKARPNIVVIVADDMGWNDVGFHGSNEIPTPNIDALAYNGVILNSHYTQALCTPSRSAFLTGKYPIHLGMQHLVILEPEPWGLPLNETILPQHLKKHGYATHIVGKWHLGFFKKEYTPMYRGFDSHYGYWQGHQDYFDHTTTATYTNEVGYDMRRNMSVDWDAKGKYSTTIFTEEAVRVIKEHDVKHPMFMYMAHLAPHAGGDDPLQAPDEEIAKFAHIADPERRIYAAMVSLLDKSVGDVVAALREKRMLENTIIVFMSDNGAPSVGIHANHGSNYPLRGMKNSPFEGASRGVAAIWSPLIKKPQRVSPHLMHISDWLPTLYAAAGMNVSELGPIDGVDMWKSISEDVEGPRTDLLYNIDDVWKYAAYRRGDYKYLYGSVSKKDSWYGSIGNNTHYTYNPMDVLFSKTATSLAGLLTYRQISEKNDRNLTDDQFSVNILDADKIAKLRSTAHLKCPKSGDGSTCNPVKSPCLFNLREDPCETTNLAESHPLVLATLEEVVFKLRKTALPIRNVQRDPNADPAKYNGTWVNWQDMDEIHKHKIHYNSLSPLAVGLISTACVLFFVAIVILLCVSIKKPKSKMKNAFPGMDDCGDDTATELTLKDGELTHIAYREITKTRE